MIDSISNLSRRLEDQFFLAQDQIMREQLARLKKEEETIGALSKVSGITDKAVLKDLVAHNIRPETLAALSLTPIIEVVWADGKVDAKEVEAVLGAAKKFGMAEDHAILKEWLHTRPSPDFADTWKKYMKGLAKEVEASTLAVMKADLLAHARAVAEASGSFLGLTNPISPQEQRVLDTIEKFLADL